jgi:hypothetical protein
MTEDTLRKASELSSRIGHLNTNLAQARTAKQMLEKKSHDKTAVIGHITQALFGFHGEELTSIISNVENKLLTKINELEIEFSDL